MHGDERSLSYLPNEISSRQTLLCRCGGCRISIVSDSLKVKIFDYETLFGTLKLDTAIFDHIHTHQTSSQTTKRKSVVGGVVARGR